MRRTLSTLSFAILLLGIGLEAALANKFETIGGGVSGLSREKVLLLKEIVRYAGGFLIFLGILALLTRNRFEGFVGGAKKGTSAATQGGIVLSIIGLLLIGLSFL